MPSPPQLCVWTQNYIQPRAHHNAMEPHATVAHWEGDRLTLWSKTQWVGNERDAIALIFGIPPGQVRVINPFVGGAFGSALRTWPHVTLAALAARQVGRPVRLELTRPQLFHSGRLPPAHGAAGRTPVRNATASWWP